MKKNRLIGLSIAALFGAFFIQGCDLVKDIEYKVTPNPLEVHGDTVTLTINGKFVEKGLHKKATVEVTPVIIGEDGQEKAFKTETFQGSKAAGNGKVIPKEGGSFSYTARLPYNKSMEAAEVKVKILPKKGTKEKALIVTDKIADATITTPYLVMSDDKVIFGTDAFVRVTSHKAEMVINYEKGRHEVRGSELKDADYVDFVKWLTWAVTNPRIDMKNITIPAYASPEGEIAINDNLANDRARTAAETIAKEFKKLKVDKGADAKNTSFYNLQGKGEDWDGFRSELDKTDIADKELIVRVLGMYSDVTKREQEIRNMAKTYQELEKKVLPKLRRSAVTLNYDLTGKTDQELTEWSKTKPDSLTVEELLFAATLTNDMNEKLRIFREVSRVHKSDWRGPNNVGAILFMQGKIEDASAEFEKAASLNSSEKIIKNNLACVARQKGDRAKAEKLLGEASGAGPEVSYNLGIIRIQQGKYGDAVSNMSGLKDKTFNLALAQVLNGDGSSANTTLGNALEKDAALSFYLRAIIAARANNIADVKSNLTTAIQKDPSLKAKAAKDREFLKFWSDASFTALVK